MQGNIQKAWGEICNTWNSTELVAIIHKDGKNTGTNCIKKDLNEPDYYNGVVSHPEPDILECEVKWTLRSTAVNKAAAATAATLAFSMIQRMLGILTYIRGKV